MPVRIALVVEGHGEIEAGPVLVRRLAAEAFDPPVYVSIPHPVRVARSKLLKEGELERAVLLAAYQAGDGGGVLVLIDADDDCPAQLGPELLKRANQVAAGRFPVRVVIARAEFETWFLSSAESLRSRRGLPRDLEPPANPEQVRGAKGWLSDRMEGNQHYSEVLDQPAFAALMNIDTARGRSDSFDKFCRDVLQLLPILAAYQGEHV